MQVQEIKLTATQEEFNLFMDSLDLLYGGEKGDVINVIKQTALNSLGLIITINEYTHEALSIWATTIHDLFYHKIKRDDNLLNLYLKVNSALRYYTDMNYTWRITLK